MNIAIKELENIFNYYPKHYQENDWDSIEKELALVLPNDYKEFIDHFSTGYIDNFIWVLNPFEKNKYLNLLYIFKRRRESYNQLKKNFPNNYLFTFFPAKNGIFPWGITDNGDTLYWKTRCGKIQDKVLVYNERPNLFDEYNSTCTEFLINLLQRKIRCSVFPEDVPSDNATFTPKK